MEGGLDNRERIEFVRHKEIVFEALGDIWGAAI
jgi:hypothetical protein